MKKTFALIILDGFGHSESSHHNPVHTATTPTLDALFKQAPHLFIDAAGEAVGLPIGQMGNSEVGHLHLGAGRKVPQDLVRINKAIETGTLFDNPVLTTAIQKAKANAKAVHIIGLLSDGGVHSHEQHLDALLSLSKQLGVSQTYLHAITDGRDTSPQSALTFIERLEKHHPNTIATLCGRYYAMDRDQRWERTQKYYDLLTEGLASHNATNALTAVKEAYTRGETDEFITPTQIKPIQIQNGDVIIVANFRADRVRQLTHAFMDKNFTHFDRKQQPMLSDYVTLTEYYAADNLSVAYPPLQIRNTLGEYLASKGLTQLRLAETEKYAHVTYFMNGGNETPYPNEDRHLIPSPRIATYDLQPEMSAPAVTDAFVEAIESGKYDLIVCNYANPDMIGHTGIISAAEKALSEVDHCLARVLSALQKTAGEALITADHGNIECMHNDKTEQPHTAHTTNQVPLIYVGRPATVKISHGALDDVAPTLLYLMGLQPPTEMTGNVLFELKNEQ